MSMAAERFVVRLLDGNMIGARMFILTATVQGINIYNLKWFNGATNTSYMNRVSQKNVDLF